MADVDPKPIGMMNSASRFYKNDNIPANSPLKKVAVESMQKRFALKPVISQYTPKGKASFHQGRYTTSYIVRDISQRRTIDVLVKDSGIVSKKCHAAEV